MPGNGMPGTDSHKSQQVEPGRIPSKLTDVDITALYDLIKGDRFAQAEVWSALEDFRNGNYKECRERVESVFIRVGGSLQETASESAEDRAKKIIEKMAADQGKAYRRVATPDLLEKTRVKAEQQVEKAKRIVTAFESVLARLESALATQVESTIKLDPDKKVAGTTAAQRAADTGAVGDDRPPTGRNQVNNEVPAGGVSCVPAGAIRAFKKSRNSEEARDKLAEFFHLRALDDQAVIQPGALFHLHGGTRGNLVRIASIENDAIQLENPVSGVLYKHVVAVAYFMTTGSQGKTHLLLPAEEPARVSGKVLAKSSSDATQDSLQGRQEAAVTRASFQMLVSDIGRAKQKLQVFSDLHKVRVSLNIDTRAITDADRGSFRKGDKVKARQQAEIIKSQVSAGVNSARGFIQKREQEFGQSKEKFPGSQRRQMESCFAPTYQSLHAVEKALRQLVQGLDAALSIDQDDSEQEE